MASVAAMIISPTAEAAAIIDFGATSEIQANNDFKAPLNGLGLTRFATLGSSIVLDAAATIRFELLGTESGFNDTFFTRPLPSSVSYTESATMQDSFLAPILLGTAAFGAGSLVDLLNFSSSGGASATVGQDGFGIFLGPDQLSGSFVDVFYFGYDDQVTGQDDDYDDMIVRATVLSANTRAVPEPATWALLLTGFGLAGAAMRRRKQHASPRLVRA